MSRAEASQARVLVFAPTGRDAAASVDLLARSGLRAEACPDLGALSGGLGEDVAAVLIAEEGLFGQDVAPLTAWVERQPAWSDLPFVILTSHQEQPAVAGWRQRLVAALRNVSLLERPVQAIGLVSTVQAAVRARLRQFEVRGLLDARERLALSLERQVAERTAELAEANNGLRAEMAERVRAEEALRQAQRIEALGQLTGGVAHDFNNLLMVISGGLDILDGQTDPARRARLMDGMMQAAARGAALTRQLLAFSRRHALKPEPINIAHQVEQMRELLDRSLGGDVDVTFDFPDGLWPVEVDPGELELVILNLAVNARDAMPKGGTVTVAAENAPEVDQNGVRSDFVRLSVRDTGTGMSPEVKQHVFEPFFTTKEVGRGSGLGLAQVHGFATQSRGRVRIDTEVGKGTTVMLLLPRSTDAPGPDPGHCANIDTPPQPSGSTGCVLLVEDDDEVAVLVSEMLGQLGYEVTRVASAAAALGALANGRHVDVVLSDIMMPGGMNGVELAREVRRRRSGLPILLTSGYAEASQREADADGIRILPKPYLLKDLAAALVQTLQPTPHRR